MGIERILFSTDYPFIIAPGRGARDFVEQAALSPEEKALVAHGNWERLTSKS